MRRLENHSAPPARQWTHPLAVMVVLGVTSCAREAPGPEHLHDRISAALDPVGQSVEASVDLTFRSPSSGLRTASFLLHRQLQVTAVTGTAVSVYRFDTTAESSIPWIPEGGMVLRQGVTLTLIGIVGGTGLAFLFARFLESAVVGVSPTDPVAIGTTALILGATSVLACYAPARWACGVDAARVLRGE
jgi:hypothetical protein